MASGGGLGGDGYSRGRSMTGIIVTTSPSATSRHVARRGGARFRRQVTSLARRETRGSATRARRTPAGGARAGGALELRPGCAAAAAPDSAQHRSAPAIGDGEAECRSCVSALLALSPHSAWRGREKGDEDKTKQGSPHAR